MIVSTLNEANLNEALFPIFFRENWKALQSKEDPRSEIYYFIDQKSKAVVPFKVTRLKIIKKGEYLYIPLSFFGKEFLETEEKRILNNFHKSISKLCDVILPPQHIVNFKSIPSKVQYFKLGIMYIDLTLTDEIIFNKMSSAYRSKIRQAERGGVVTFLNEKTMSEFYDLYFEVLARQNMEYESKKFFEDQLTFLPENLLISISKFQDQIESSVYCLYDEFSCYYLYGGAAEYTNFSGSNKLLFWNLIRHIKSQGQKKLILGGFRENIKADSKLHGIQNFKIKFGASIQEGYHFIKVINPIRYWLFNFALKIKSKIKGKPLSIIRLDGLELKISK
jgi:lipid II:glycine glycyltransferase (peptidoglycan interpeptide bridge formation enzyme)